MSPRSIPLLLAFLVATATTIVEAQDQPDAQSQAIEHFNNGVQLYSEGAYDAALVEFREANRLSPHWRVRYNLGQVHFQMGEYADAIREFRGYLKEGGSEIDPERRASVEQYVAQLRVRIGSISVEANVEGAQVQINGEDVGETPLDPHIVNIGRHRVVVEAEGYQRQEKLVQVTADGTEELKFQLQPIRLDAEGKPIIITQVEKEESRAPWLLILSTSLAIAGATAAGIAGGMAFVSNGQLDEALGTIPADHDRIDLLRARVSERALIADIAGGVAIAAGIVAVIALATGGKKDKEAKPTTLFVHPTGAVLQHTF